MKLNQSIIQRLRLSEQELEDLKTAVSRDKQILATLSRIFRLRQAEAQAVASDYDNPNWPYRRAYKDGRLDELQFLINLLELDKE